MHRVRISHNVFRSPLRPRQLMPGASKNRILLLNLGLAVAISAECFIARPSSELISANVTNFA